MRKRRVIAALATVVAVGVASIVMAVPANASAGAYVEIVNAITGKCADVAGESLVPGAHVHQWDCENHANQLWRPEDQGNGYIMYQNLLSGLCLTATPLPGGYTMSQNACVTSSLSLWRWEVADSAGHEVLESGVANMCFALDGVFSARNGWAIVLHDCANTNGQYWRTDA